MLLPNYNYDKLDEKNTILKVSLYLPNKVNCPNYDLYTYGGNVTLHYVSFKLWCGFPHTFGKYLHFYTHMIDCHLTSYYVRFTTILYTRNFVICLSIVTCFRVPSLDDRYMDDT